MTGQVLAVLSDISREDWLALRGLGSSDASAICGLNPYRTAYQVWAEKNGFSEPQEENEAMRFGKLLEPVIASEFQTRTGIATERADSLVRHPEHQWMTATCDYWIEENGERGILECKNENAFAGRDTETIPDHAHIQLMHQLAVTGLSYGYVARLIGGNKLVWHRVERDEELIAKLIDIESNFWQLVESKTPPTVSSGDSDILAIHYPSSNGQSIELPSLAEPLIHQYLDWKSAMKRADDNLERIGNELKALLGDNERGYCGGMQVMWKTMTQNRKAQPEKTLTFRKFEIKEIKQNGKE